MGSYFVVWALDLAGGILEPLKGKVGHTCASIRALRPYWAKHIAAQASFLCGGRGLGFIGFRI